MNYVHCVFFDCGSATAAEEIEAQVADAQDLLAKIPTVKLVHSGQRDVTMQRPVSATDFQIGLTVIFDDRAGLDLYANHPLHLEYMARYKKNWQGIRVYDFEG